MVRVHLSPVGVESTNGGVAQLGEHLPCKQGVKSSNLSISTQINLSSSLLAGRISDCACTEKLVWTDKNGYLQNIRERETGGLECPAAEVNSFRSKLYLTKADLFPGE